jgi:hypothetical protein
MKYSTCHWPCLNTALAAGTLESLPSQNCIIVEQSTAISPSHLSILPYPCPLPGHFSQLQSTAIAVAVTASGLPPDVLLLSQSRPSVRTPILNQQLKLPARLSLSSARVSVHQTGTMPSGPGPHAFRALITLPELPNSTS